MHTTDYCFLKTTLTVLGHRSQQGQVTGCWHLSSKKKEQGKPRMAGATLHNGYKVTNYYTYLCGNLRVREVAGFILVESRDILLL